MAQQVSTRDGFGVAIKKLAKKDRNVVMLDCDLGRSTRSHMITEVDKSRFFEMGIAEQDMVSTASGMASMAKIPFVNSFAVFVTGRCFDQIRQQVALPKANVKICGSSAGLTQGYDGATHQSVLDVSLMRSLPNMVVVAPADFNQTEQAVEAIYRYQGPVYLRLSRYSTGNFLSPSTRFTLGRAQILDEGSDILLASYGPVLKNVLAASEILGKNGHRVGVVNFHTIKPFDSDTLTSLTTRYSIFVSIEEHSIYGGLGSAIAECLAENITSHKRIRFLRLGIRDVFGESGGPDELLEKHGLHAIGITERVMSAL